MQDILSGCPLPGGGGRAPGRAQAQAGVPGPAQAAVPGPAQASVHRCAGGAVRQDSSAAQTVWAVWTVGFRGTWRIAKCSDGLYQTEGEIQRHKKNHTAKNW